MNIFNKISYNSNYLLSSFLGSDGILYKIYLSKSYYLPGERNQFFLKLMKENSSTEMKCISYLYFYINEKRNNTEFIGAFTDYPERNKGFSSILFSFYIKLCMDENINEFLTSRKQRKPFLLYILKTYNYELKNPLLYITHKDKIFICKKKNDFTKYLLFENQRQKEIFKKGKIMEHDNYKILDILDKDTLVLDKVLLSQIYRMENKEEAYKKSLKKLKTDKI